MSELPGGIPPAEVPEPHDAALGVIFRPAADGGVEVLLGRRSRRARFMASHLAFPGGRLEEVDRPGEPGDLRRCVAREVVEEVGLSIPADRWREAGVRITPPIFPVRFRAAFFVAELPRDQEVPAEPPSGENEAFELARPDDVIRRWAAGRAQVPPPVLAVLRALAGRRETDLEDVVTTIARANRHEERVPRMEFVPGVWLFPVHTATLPPATHTNVWMPVGERFAVVDPGSDRPGEIESLLRVVDRLAATGARPGCVVLTHHHQDHVAGAAAVAGALGVAVRAHRTVLERIAARLDGAPTEPIEPDDRIDLGGATLRAVLTEGHAPGHLALHVAESDVLISGDLVSALSTMLIDPREGDMETYLESLRRAERLGVRQLLPSHGPPVPPRALSRTIEHRLERERRVLDAVADGVVELDAIARRAYEDTPDAPPFLARSQTLAHLLRLDRLGKVRAEADGVRYRPCV